MLWEPAGQGQSPSQCASALSARPVEQPGSPSICLYLWKEKLHPTRPMAGPDQEGLWCVCSLSSECSLLGRLPGCEFSSWEIIGTMSPASLPLILLSAPYTLPVFSLLRFPILLSSCECLVCQPKSFPPVHQQISAPVLFSRMTLSCLVPGTLGFSFHQVRMERLPHR